MASAPTATTKEVTLALPADVLREIDALAAEKGRTQDQVILGAIRRFLIDERRWRELQSAAAQHAAAAGLRTEDDIEDYLDSLPDPD
jgi:predicted transcriptional regulator